MPDGAGRGRDFARLDGPPGEYGSPHRRVRGHIANTAKANRWRRSAQPIESPNCWQPPTAQGLDQGDGEGRPDPVRGGPALLRALLMGEFVVHNTRRVP